MGCGGWDRGMPLRGEVFTAIAPCPTMALLSWKQMSGGRCGHACMTALQLTTPKAKNSSTAEIQEVTSKDEGPLNVLESCSSPFTLWVTSRWAITSLSV